MTAQFRERLQSSQYALMQQQQQQQQTPQSLLHNGYNPSNVFVPYQNLQQARLMGAGAQVIPGAGQIPFQRGIAIPRWPLLNQNNPYNQRNNIFAQQPAVQSQAAFFVQQNQQNFNKS